MMLVLALLALAAAEPPAAAPAVSAPAAEAPGEDTASSLAGLQQMYDQSCAAREYGAYDDLCDQLRQQLKAARVQADREARRKAAEAGRHARPPRTEPQPPAPPAPVASPAPALAPA